MKIIQFLFLAFIMSTSVWVSTLVVSNDDSENVELTQDLEEDSQDDTERDGKEDSMFESTYLSTSETMLSGKRNSIFKLLKDNLSEFNLGVTLNAYPHVSPIGRK
jgi:hypothetical protein